MKCDFLKKLEISEINAGGCVNIEEWTPIDNRDVITSISPINNEPIAKIALVNAEDYENIIKKTQEAFHKWQMVPAPQRGEIIRQIGTELRKMKEPLAQLITLENGKIISEALGEVQEMIDMRD